VKYDKKGDQIHHCAVVVVSDFKRQKIYKIRSHDIYCY